MFGLHKVGYKATPGQCQTSRALVLLLFFDIVSAEPDYGTSIDIDLFGSFVSICLPGSSCNNRCGAILDGLSYTCSCDNECTLYRDCCYDFEDKCQLGNQDKTRESINTKYTSCLRTNSSNSLTGHHVISECIDKYTEEKVRKNCEHPDITQYLIYKIPVTDRVGIVYQNMYCAICNGIQITDIVAWRVTASCELDYLSSDVSDSFSFYDSLNSVSSLERNVHKSLGKDIYCRSYDYTPPLEQKLPRPCVLGIETCPNFYLDEQTRTGCAAYSAPVYTADISFKNPHCAICNNYEDQYSCEMFELDVGSGMPDSVGSSGSLSESLYFYDQPGTFTSLDILVNFATGKLRVHSEPITYTNDIFECGEGEVYDYINGNCVCGDGSACVRTVLQDYNLDESECEEKLPFDEFISSCPNAMKQSVNVVYLVETKNTSNSDNLKDFIIDRIIGTNIIFENQTMKHFADYRLFNISFVALSHHDVSHLSFVVNNWVYVQDIEVSKLKLVKFVYYCRKIITNSTTKNCTDEPINVKSNFSRENNGSSVYDPVNGFMLDLTYDIRSDLSICINVTFDPCPDYSIYTPLFDTVFESSNITIIKDGHSHKYLLIVNIIGVVLSLCGLFLTFTIRCVFCELRTHSGKIIMNLCLALFIAQLLTLLQGNFVGNPRVCTAMAATSHYIWLVAFLWMNSVAIDFFRVFRTLNLIAKDAIQNMIFYRRYMIYSWCTPLVIVLILLTLNYKDFQNFNFQYGDEYACWIRDGFANFLLFGLPIATIISVNFVLFICTVYGIRTAKCSTRFVRKKGNEILEEFTIYIKISIIIGLTWVFGFLASFIDHIVILYIFIILNTSQGLFISIAFNFNKSVKSIFDRKRLRKRSRTEPEGMLRSGGTSQV